METILVIKIGGNVIDDEEALSGFLIDFSKIKEQKILVHGGGKIATELSKKLNIEPVIIDGRRITDQAALDIVTMVYGGLINRKIVAQLQSLHCNAIGLTGADANLISAHKRIHPQIDFGFVGDIDKINGELLLDLLDKNISPVIAPLTHDKNGNILNTNADTIAAEIAIELSKTKKIIFIYCFEKAGLLADIENEETVINAVKLEEIEQLKEKQIITGGMVPKVENITNALKKGVEKVILCNAKNVSSILAGNTNFGTIFTT
ncbi:MAG: N-acetylglutamate kinase [Bacteroidota bacterium]|nr:N-acetylglutamate kinase [Bacteroidota bacterium]